MNLKGSLRALFALVMILAIAAFGWVVGPASPWFGLIASFCVLGLLDLAMPYVQLRLPGSLRELRPWEVRGSVYRAMGVLAFGAILRGTPLRLLNQRVYLGASPRGLGIVRSHIENAEAAHFWGGLMTVPYLVLAWDQGWKAAFTTVMLFNLVVNAYPIFHLRSVRARMGRTLQQRHSLH